MKKKLWERTAYRVTVFLLCALCTGVAVYALMLGDAKIGKINKESNNNVSIQIPDMFTSKQYIESGQFNIHAGSCVSNLAYLYTNFMGSDGISVTEGEAYDRAVRDELHSIYSEIRLYCEDRIEYSEDDSYRYDFSAEGTYYWYGYWDNRYSMLPLEFDIDKMRNSSLMTENGRLKQFGDPGAREEFEAIFPEQVDVVRRMVAENREESYWRTVKALDGLYYYVSEEGKVLSSINIDEDGHPVDMSLLTGQRAWIVIENGLVQSEPQGLAGEGMRKELGSARLYLAWPEDNLTVNENYYLVMKQTLWLYFGSAVFLAILAVVFFIMSLVFTGRRRPAFENTRKLWVLDKIFVEIQVIILIVITAIVLSNLPWILRSYGGVTWNTNPLFYSVLGGNLVFVFTAVALWFILSIARIGKAGLFAERSLIARFVNGPCRKLGSVIKSGYNGRNPLAKTIIPVFAMWFVTAFFTGLCSLYLFRSALVGFVVAFILLIIVLVCALYFTYKWVGRYGRLRKGVEEIASGNLDYKIEIDGDGKNEFDRLSAMVNELGSAQNIAIQSELKNQRLKTDLISNVSHDLKTPLTSILTYTDLLKAEGLGSKNAEEYLQVIDEKGKRLRKLTEDLFDAAKASSGALNVRKEKVDLLALINQEIAEANGSFADAGLELVVDAADEHYYACADSQLLWRVVDNLLGNTRKYAQQGTRVYISLKAVGKAKKISLEIKNISATKLNIPPEELMERFKRGDESRATDGSGLGLAIAKDLVRLQGGWFEITIDGDLFKAVVTLPEYIEESAEE